MPINLVGGKSVLSIALFDLQTGKEIVAF